MKIGLLRSTPSPGRAARPPSARPSPGSPAPPTTSASTRSGSWTTSSRSAASARPTDPMLEGWTTLGYMAGHTTRARLGLMVGGVHYRQPGAVGQGGDDARRAVRRPGLARHRRGLERGGVARPRLPVPAARRAVRDARGHAPRSPTGCGRASAAPRPPSTAATSMRPRLLNSPQSLTPAAPADHGRRRRRAEDAPPRGPVRRRHERLRRTRDAIHHKYEVLRAHCEAVGRPYDEIERSTLQASTSTPAGGRGPSTPAGVVDRVRRAGRRRRPARHLQHRTMSTTCDRWS